ncbi:MaoC/PaaZ C-terminal domain-containing protein [Sporosarcina sp. E16_8]|uniref:MaoC/PaaZ C-terminal domain-containing protein n=1 Tax=Sporosarcina sp. E16_8 TaxID=2789295 RepID=UPI001A9208C6|nr:3-hydroxyacyl-ACP dehydratase [Sporosarcina sp. E16_8]
MKELPSIIKPPIEHIDLVKYAGASGDFNKIHTVSHIANEKGYPDVIVHGMFLMGWASQAIEEWFPKRRLHRFGVRFMAPTYPGETLVIKGKLLEPNAEAVIDIGSLEIVDSKGEIKLKGSFELSKGEDGI